MNIHILKSEKEFNRLKEDVIARAHLIVVKTNYKHFYYIIKSKIYKQGTKVKIINFKVL